MRELSEEEVLALFQSCSNRGRWGPDDEQGTLNFISPEKRVAAARLVRDGIVIPLAHDLSSRPSPKNLHPLVHRMLYVGHTDPIGCVDEITIAPHGFGVTHLDALGHLYFEGETYNGRRAAECVTSEGMSFGSIMALKEGIVTRGVLLDVAAVRGLPWLPPTEGVSREDLEQAERAAGVRIERGDAVFVRVGLGAREAQEGEENPAIRAGLSADCLPWLHEREVAVYSGDCVEQFPSRHSRVPCPLHQIGFVAIGLIMLDNVEVEALAATARRLGRHEFLLTCAPLPIPGGTGSPINPLAVF